MKMTGKTKSKATLMAMPKGQNEVKMGVRFHEHMETRGKTNPKDMKKK